MSHSDKLFTTNIAHSLSYWLYLPEGYDADADKRWPVILYLHGSGERGDGVSTAALPRMLKEGELTDFPFIVIAPQCPEEDWWASYDDVLIALVNKVIADYNVDEMRVYLTGMSMGGFGTWHLTTEYPDRFAAIAPICGFGPDGLGFPERLKRIVHVPVWNFHGDADTTVPIQASNILVKNLKAYGGNVKFTVYPGVKHNSWDHAYAEQGLYDWFLEHKRQK